MGRTDCSSGRGQLLRVRVMIMRGTPPVGTPDWMVSAHGVPVSHSCRGAVLRSGVTLNDRCRVLRWRRGAGAIAAGSATGLVVPVVLLVLLVLLVGGLAGHLLRHVPVLRDG